MRCICTRSFYTNHFIIYSAIKGYRKLINFLMPLDKMLQNVASLRKHFFLLFRLTPRMKLGDSIRLFNYKTLRLSKYLKYIKVISAIYPLKLLLLFNSKRFSLAQSAIPHSMALCRTNSHSRAYYDFTWNYNFIIIRYLSFCLFNFAQFPQ